MLNSIGGARTRTFFKLTDGAVIMAFVSETFFGLKIASNWSGRSTKKIAVHCYHNGGSVREVCHLRYGVFPTARTYILEIVKLLLEKNKYF